MIDNNHKRLELVVASIFAVLCTINLISCNNGTEYDEDSVFDETAEIDKGSIFDEDGKALYPMTKFELKEPSKIKFFVEVSGSMNGFFRANQPTGFKLDVYEIMKHYSKKADSVNLMIDKKGNYRTVDIADFNTQMNTGKFGASPNSTDMKSMISNIINNLDVKSGEVAVLISDMKFDPVGGDAPKVQIAQYSTDIAELISDFGKAVSLVCATSDYLDKNGNVRVEQSPYYYLILGNGPRVAHVRNYISKVLNENGRFIDNIETGFDYDRAPFTFGIPTKCEQIDDEPSFEDFEKADDEDTCTIRLKIPLENFRSILSDKKIFKECFKAKCQEGSEIRIASINIETGEDQPIAAVELKIWDMFNKSDIIEWNMELPDEDHSKMAKFWEDAEDPLNPSKSFSLESFCKGMFKDGNGNKELKPNYILIKK